MATLKNLTINDTGYVRLPQGTTAQRITPVAGMVRFNTDNNATEVYTGSEWKNVSGSVQSATGGTIGPTTIGGFKVHTFTSPGTFVPTYGGSVELLVVAGGGGGSGLAGGGGGGGVIYNGSYSVTAGTSYVITVGTGGAGATGHTTNNQADGNPSIFGGPTGVVAVGGGRGASYPASPTVYPGGSGGGGGGGGPPGWRPFGEGIVGQGHPGGWGHHNIGPGGGPGAHVYPQPSICMYGGGGGAGEMGYNRQGLYYEARGGDGIASTILGTGTTYYAGGGAGGAHGPSGNYARDPAGRSLGGGGGSHSGGPQSYMDATGYGSGGGSAYHPDGYRSGNGSAGIVIVKYRSS
jgi:hypothetical protein